MKKNTLAQHYREACPERQKLLLSCKTPLCFIPPNWPISPWISYLQEEKRPLIELDPRFPLKSLENHFLPNSSETDLFQLLDTLQQISEPHIFVLSDKEELDYWSSSFFIHLFKSSTPHQLWFHGESTLLKSIVPQDLWTQHSLSSEENSEIFKKSISQELSWPLKFQIHLSLDETFFIAEAALEWKLSTRFFKKFQPTNGLSSFWEALKKHYSLREQNELLLRFASVEGRYFSAHLLYLLLQNCHITFANQDTLEDRLDEQLSPFVEHFGFIGGYLSCYRFRFSWIPKLLCATEFLLQHPQIPSGYWGLLQLFQNLSYPSEGIKRFPPKATMEQVRWNRYCLFGYIPEYSLSLEILSDSWKEAFLQTYAFELYEKYFWQKNEKKLPPLSAHFIYPWKKFSSSSSSEFVKWREQDLSFSTRPLFEKTFWIQAYRRTLILEGEFSKLPSLFEEHLSWLIHPEEYREKGNCFFEQGIVAYYQREEQKALSYFYEAQSYYQQGGCFSEEVYASQRIFDLEFRQDNFDKAIFALQQTKPYLVPQTSAWFLIYHRMGYFYQMFGDIEQARHFLEKAEESVNYGPPEEILELFARLAHLCLNHLEYYEARYYYQKALPWAKKQKDRYRETLLLTNLADIHLRLSEHAQAASFYQEALQLWETFPLEKQKEYQSTIKQVLDDIKFLEEHLS